MSTNNLNVNSDVENTDDDLDSLLAESLLEVERKKALKKIARDKVNSRLLTEDQKELLQQEENLKWVDEQDIIHVALTICKCGSHQSEIRGFYKIQYRLTSPETKRLIKSNINQDKALQYVTQKNLDFCAYCLSTNNTFTCVEAFPILKGLL